MRRALFAAAALAAPACGQLNGGDYAGEPLLRIDGRILGLSPPPPPARSFVAVRWGPDPIVVEPDPPDDGEGAR